MRSFFTIVVSTVAIMLPGITQSERAQLAPEISRPVSSVIGPEVEAVRSQLTGVVAKYGGTAALPGISYQFYYRHEPLVVAAREIGPASPVSIASTSKSLTSFAMLRLAREGKIDLDAPVSSYLPDFARHEVDPRNPVTVRHLLQHRSGIPYSGGPAVAVNGVYIPAPRVPAGRYFEYSNMNYELVALIMERVTGRPFKRLMEDLVIRFLGLRSTYLAGYAHGASGVISTTADLTAFADYLLRDYEAHGEGSFIEELARPPAGIPSTGQQDFYGLGWRVTRKDGEVYSMYHAGDWHHGVSVLMIYPRFGAAFAYLANPPDYRSEDVLTVKGSVMAYSTRLAEQLARNEAQQNEPPSSATRARVGGYTGRYRSPYNGLTVEVSGRRNGLTISRAGQRIPLRPINDWEFQGESPYRTYQFFFDEKNNVVGLTDYTSYYVKEER